MTSTDISKLRKKLAKKLKQREKNPRPVGMDSASRSPVKRMRRMSRDHSDLLQNIEFGLVKSWRENPEVDDLAVLDALRASFNGTQPKDEITFSIVECLSSLRNFRDDVSNDLWNDGIRVVMDSVKRRSRLQPGNRDYLSFVSKYIV
jgi:hypothetical protein